MSRRLTESRMIRIYLMALAALGIVAILNAGVAWWITREAVRLADSDKVVPEVLDSVASAAIAGAAVGGGIATITTALIARYGAREATRNLGHQGDSNA
jgi:predicted ABC-type sugar transport system permease subunit